MNDEHWATVIKIAAVTVAAPRWIGAYEKRKVYHYWPSSAAGG